MTLQAAGWRSARRRCQEAVSKGCWRSKVRSGGASTSGGGVGLPWE